MVYRRHPQLESGGTPAKFWSTQPSPEVKPCSFSDDTPNQAVEAPQPKLSLPKPPFSGHSAIPPASGIPQPSFSWPTRIPYQQLPTSSSILQQFSWLTRFLSSSKQRQASFPSLVFLANQASPPASTNLQQPSAEVSWLTRVPSSSKQRQPSFPSVVFPGQPGFPTGSYQPATAFCSSFSWLTRFLSSSKQRQASDPSLVFLASQASPPASTNQQQQSAEIFLAKQGSQQQQARTSVIPQPSFSWPTRIPQQQLPTSSSNLQKVSWLNRVPSSSKQEQALFPSLVFPGQAGFPSSSYQPAAAICRSFPG